ncbi:MAG: hypothetical protein ABWJ42_05030 [Sulfolobales archaeon]
MSRDRRFRKSVSELISIVILTTIAISIGIGVFYLASLWVSDTIARNKRFEIADLARFDFQAGVEAFTNNPDGSITIYVRIIRVGALIVTGIQPFISVETTSREVREASLIWFVGLNNINVVDATSIAYSNPIDPQNLPPAPEIIQFNTCTSGSAQVFSGAGLSKVYVKSGDTWVALSDLSRGVSFRLNSCKIPLPPAPLGQILVRVTIPSSVASTSNYIVVSGWIMIDNYLFNVFNVLYRVI